MSQDLVSPEVVEMEPAQPTMNLFGTQDPVEVIRRASEHATALTDVVEKRKLYKLIPRKYKDEKGNWKTRTEKYVQVEGWTLLGSMIGVFAIPMWTKELEDGWEARVEARTLNGQIVGAAEAECRRTESKWAKADSYAIRSMAQTRAVSKALRVPLGFIVELAGFRATPAEEMAAEIIEESSSGSVSKKAARERLSYVLKDLSPIPLPPDLTFETWADFAQSEMEQRFGVKASKDLTIAQLDELTDYLRTFDTIPLER